MGLHGSVGTRIDRGPARQLACSCVAAERNAIVGSITINVPFDSAQHRANVQLASSVVSLDTSQIVDIDYSTCIEGWRHINTKVTEFRAPIIFLAPSTVSLQNSSADA